MKKCEIAGIDSVNWVQVALYGMKCVNLHNEIVKILGVHFSYNNSLEQDKNFCEYIVKIEDILRSWRMRQLTLEVRITVFKSVSKVIHPLLIAKININTIDFFLIKYRKTLFGNRKRQKLNTVFFAMAMKREV